MITCTRKFEFDAAHRVLGHEHKCKHLHGHRYVLEVSFHANSLDKIGRVIDFGKIKDIIASWINDNLDHNVILYNQDIILGSKISAVTEQNIYYMATNPTAENIASHLYEDILPKLFKDYEVKITEIKLSETPNCWVHYKG